MDKILEDIAAGKFKNTNETRDKKKSKKDIERKKKWYKIGKVLLQGHKVKMCKESQVAARRTYKYYHEDKGNWKGPSARKLSKMKKGQFEQELRKRSPPQEDITLENVLEYIEENLQDWNPEEEINGMI